MGLFVQCHPYISGNKIEGRDREKFLNLCFWTFCGYHFHGMLLFSCLGLLDNHFIPIKVKMMWTRAFKFQTHCELVADHVGCPFSISSVNLDWPLLRPLFLASRTLIHAHRTLVLLPCTCTWDAFIWYLGRSRIQAQCRYLWCLLPISDISRQDPELLLEMIFLWGPY